MPQATAMFSLIWRLEFFMHTWNLLFVNTKIFPLSFVFTRNPLNGCSFREVFSINPLYVSMTWRACNSVVEWQAKKEVAWGRQWWMGSVWSHRLSVKHTLHLSLVPLPFKEHQQALHNSVAYWRGGRWDTQRWSALIKVRVLERWIKSKQHEMILTFVMWTWEHLCMLVRVCAGVCVVRQCQLGLIRLPLKVVQVDLIRAGWKV